jgi:hypothetical protein
MTSVANTVAMTTLAVHTLQPLIFYNRSFELQSFIIDRRKWDVNTRIRAHITAGSRSRRAGKWAVSLEVAWAPRQLIKRYKPVSVSKSLDSCKPNDGGAQLFVPQV